MPEQFRIQRNEETAMYRIVKWDPAWKGYVPYDRKEYTSLTSARVELDYLRTTSETSNDKWKLVPDV